MISSACTEKWSDNFGHGVGTAQVCGHYCICALRRKWCCVIVMSACIHYHEDLHLPEHQPTFVGTTALSTVLLIGVSFERRNRGSSWNTHFDSGATFPERGVEEFGYETWHFITFKHFSVLFAPELDLKCSLSKPVVWVIRKRWLDL